MELTKEQQERLSSILSNLENEIELLPTVWVSAEMVHENEGQIPDVPRNPRFIRDEKYEALKKSIIDDPEMLGMNPIKVYPLYDNYFVAIGGNMRSRALLELGFDKFPCKILPKETSAKKLRAYVNKDNYGYGENDQAVLKDDWAEFMDEFEDWGMDDMIMDFDDDEEEKPKSTSVKDDNYDAEKEKPQTKCQKGDLWLLGNHRLFCGDSTLKENFEILMGGERADISFTSPPYGVNNGTIRNHQEKGMRNTEAKNFYNEYDDNQDNWVSLVELTWQRMHENSDMQFINIQMLSDNKRELVKWCARHADNLCDIMIWDKGHSAPQMAANVMNNVFEFIYVFGENNATRALKYGNFHGNVNLKIEIPIGHNDYADVHKAVFPIELPAKILEINSNAKSVIDCFGGTGTTLIAAEQMGRKCFMMELDPLYCDIIIDRWEKITGKKAQKITW